MKLYSDYLLMVGVACFVLFLFCVSPRRTNFETIVANYIGWNSFKASTYITIQASRKTSNYREGWQVIQSSLLKIAYERPVISHPVMFTLLTGSVAKTVHLTDIDSDCYKNADTALRILRSWESNIYPPIFQGKEAIFLIKPAKLRKVIHRYLKTL